MLCCSPHCQESLNGEPSSNGFTIDEEGERKSTIVQGRQGTPSAAIDCTEEARRRAEATTPIFDAEGLDSIAAATVHDSSSAHGALKLTVGEAVAESEGRQMEVVNVLPVPTEASASGATPRDPRCFGGVPNGAEAASSGAFEAVVSGDAEADAVGNAEQIAQLTLERILSSNADNAQDRISDVKSGWNDEKAAENVGRPSGESDCAEPPAVVCAGKSGRRTKVRFAVDTNEAGTSRGLPESSSRAAKKSGLAGGSSQSEPGQSSTRKSGDAEGSRSKGGERSSSGSKSAASAPANTGTGIGTSPAATMTASASAAAATSSGSSATSKRPLRRGINDCSRLPLLH